MRFPLEVFDAVRAVFPSNRPVTMRVSATDWLGGASHDDMAVLAIAAPSAPPAGG